MPSVFEIIEHNVASTLSDRYHSVFQQLEAQPDLLGLLLVCCYVHSCRTPISMDMLLAYFRGTVTSHEQMYRMKASIGAVITDYVGEFDDGEQDYFVPRSSFVAEAVLDKAPLTALQEMLKRFHTEISVQRIHRYDVFRRRAYDADVIGRAFPDWEDGLSFYRDLYTRDASPYLLQQGAIYLSRRAQHHLAFGMIDEALAQSAQKIPSIRNSHAIILFRANISKDETPDGIVQQTLKRSMDILDECYRYDQRKIYHALVFADQALQFYNRYPGPEGREYLARAQKWLSEELRDKSWHRGARRMLEQVSRHVPKPPHTV